MDYAARCLRNRRAFLCEPLEARLCLSQVAFTSHVIVESEAPDPVVVQAADIDGDGHEDVLCALQGDDRIAWYRNTDGRGALGTQRLVNGSLKSPEQALAIDLDGDGDRDVLAAGAHEIAWYENTDGKGTFGPSNVIRDAGANSLHAADVDGDGDLDVLAGSGQNKSWFENVDGQGSFGQQQFINRAEYRSYVHLADVDGDGDADAVVGDWDNLSWHENVDGQGSFGEPKLIVKGVTGRVVAADLDGDGDLDALSASKYGGGVLWYENMDGSGSFSEPKVIAPVDADSQTLETPVHIGDVDGDGDLDVVSTSSSQDAETGARIDEVVWYENQDGKGGFGSKRVVTREVSDPESVHLGDLDGDGDLDLLSGSTGDDTVAWYENTGGGGAFGPQQRVAYSENNGPSSVYASDLDNDGDPDLLAAFYGQGKVVWHENTGGPDRFSQQRVVTADAGGASSVHAADLDGDHDSDVLVASTLDGRIQWHENTDGLASFEPRAIAARAGESAESARALDLDGDGDMDVLAAFGSQDEETGDRTHQVLWYENDSAGQFNDQHVIDTTVGFTSQKVYAMDLDGDGDTDVLSDKSIRGTSAHRYTWYANDGQGSFVRGATGTIGRDGYPADLDSDGDADVLTQSGFFRIDWLENVDGVDRFGLARELFRREERVYSLHPADLDLDGDTDVLYVSSHLAWYENINGRGPLSERPPISAWTLVDPKSIYTGDLDNDGDVDVVSASSGDGRIAWYEQFQPDAGDANRDRRLDQLDIVEVLQAGKYLTGFRATWQTGDWNGDRVFDQLDIIAALQTGAYLKGAQPT